MMEVKLEDVGIRRRKKWKETSGGGGFVHFGEMLLSRTEGLTMMDGSVL